MALSCLLIFSSACAPSGGQATQAPSENVSPNASEPSNTIATAAQSPKKNSTIKIAVSYQSPEFNSAGVKYVPTKVEAKVAPYQVQAKLANVENASQFSNLNSGQIDSLVKNAFVVSPTTQEQLFYIYEDNSYKKIPSFISSDSVLQVYHIFYDYALRNAETSSFYENTVTLTENMMGQLIKEYSSVSDAELKAQVLKAIAYFGVAQTGFAKPLPANFPSEAKSLVDSEYALLKSAAGKAISPILGVEIDYSLFTPRGHYTRSKTLTDYFMGMSWYGVACMPLFKDDNIFDEQSTLCAIVITDALARLDKEKGEGLWEKVYSPTAFFVGYADDITPFQYKTIYEGVYGKTPDLNSLADKELLKQFCEAAKQLPPPVVGENAGDAGIQMRFMGQRYLMDSEVLQRLSKDIVRPFPSGLDVFAAFGSARAEELINKYLNPSEAWPEYPQELSKARDKFTKLSEAEWQKNMYTSWLWTLNALAKPAGENYPSFMLNEAWQDKSLHTAMGNWSELRHDTILYGKGSASECGDGEEAPILKGYVEPNVELYERLLWLTTYSKSNLSARGVLPESVQEKMESFEELLTFLRDCSVKELNGKELSQEEYDSLLTYGGTLEYLSSSLVSTENDEDFPLDSWYSIESDTDRNMAVIADVHTVANTDKPYLEVGVGTASEIYVVVPIGGKLYLTRGAVFDYFEFPHESRLTDEQWQKMVADGVQARPPWTESFMQTGTAEVPTPAVPYSSGC